MKLVVTGIISYGASWYCTLAQYSYGRVEVGSFFGGSPPKREQLQPGDRYHCEEGACESRAVHEHSTQVVAYGRGQLQP